MTVLASMPRQHTIPQRHRRPDRFDWRPSLEQDKGQIEQPLSTGTDRGNGSGACAYSFGPFRLLVAQRLLLQADKPVRLGSRAFDILIALVERQGESVSKCELMERVWPDTTVVEANLSVHIAALRRVLRDGHDGNRYLVNIPGRGYRFVATVETEEDLRQSGSATGATKDRFPAIQLLIERVANTLAEIALGDADAPFVTDICRRLDGVALMIEFAAAQAARTDAEKPVSDVAESLSARERSILERISKGRSNEQIARELQITPETVKSHIKNTFVKLAVDNRVHAVSTARSLGSSSADAPLDPSVQR